MAIISSWERIPDELWEKIFTHLSLHSSRLYGDLRSVSLVCKRFLAVSNRTVTYVAIDPSTKPVPLPPLSRFPNVSSFRLGPDPDLDASIALFAASDLPLRSLHLSGQTHFPRDAMRLLGHRMCRTLIFLSCVQFNVNDDDLALVAASFPYLQKFDLYSLGNRTSPDDVSVTDKGILEISTGLKSLVSVNIMCQMHLTHRSLEYLTSNCPYLLDLRFGFGGFGSLDQLDSFYSFQSLSTLHLRGANISHNVLVQLSKVGLKLQKLHLVRSQFTSDVTGEVLCGFLKSCRSLRHLKVAPFPIPDDTNAIDLAASVPNIQVIDLFAPSTHPIPPATLLHLLTSCPLLEEIHIACSFLGITQDWFNNTSKQFRVRTLDLFFCDDLCDETLKLLVSVCPKLKGLFLMRCSNITRTGIESIAASCSNIKSFYLGNNETSSDFRIDRRNQD